MKTTQLEMFNETLKFVRVSCVGEAGPLVRMVSPADVAKIHRNEVSTRPEYDPEVEQFVVYMLDTHLNVKFAQIVTKGLMNTCLVHPRETFRPAVACKAHSIVVAHNHPSGNTSPSPEDLKVTRDLVAAGKVLGIKVLDHLIITDRPNRGESVSFLSLRESGLVNFDV